MLNTEIKKRDYSHAAENFFINGNYKGIPVHNPKSLYTREYHLSKTNNEKLKQKMLEIERSILNLDKNVNIVYSKRRICYKNAFKFMTLEVGKKSIYIELKTKSGWNTLKLKENDEFGYDSQSLLNMFNMSKKPDFSNELSVNMV